jgi:competence protein ComEA
MPPETVPPRHFADSVNRALWFSLIAFALLALPVMMSDCEASGQTRRGEARPPNGPVQKVDATPGGPLQIDVNAATAAELEQIKGIGPRTAQRIVDSREAGGRFRDADDLRKRVAGIGPAKIKTMKAGGLVVPDAQGTVSPSSGQPRVEMIVGQPQGKREPRRGSVTALPPPGSHR